MDEGYRLRNAGNPSGASQAFSRGLEGADPATAQRIELELAYLEMQQGERSDARVHFERAEEGPDQELSAQASREIEAMPSHWWGDFYAEYLMWHRFSGYDNSNGVATVRIRGAYRPFLDVDLNFYVFGQVTRDLRSRGSSEVGIPLIYADNYALVGGGVLLRLLAGRIGLFAQAGPAFNLNGDGRSAVDFDARAGVLGGIETSQCRIPSNGDVHLISAFCAELYGEAVWVHRFDDNVIAFLRGRISHGWLLTGPVLWAPYVEARIAADVNGDYYNNLADAGVGHRWRLLRPFPADALLGIHAGTYLGAENVDRAPDQLTYVELRLVASTYFDF
jgi:hypothetical protein